MTERRYIKVKDFRIKKNEEGPAVLSGYAAVFNSLSEELHGYFREKIKPGAFKKALKNSDTRALFNHDPNLILGRSEAGTLRLKEDKTGLYMEVDLPDTQYARDLQTSVERGDVTQQSFGFTIEKDQWEEDKDKKTVTRTLLVVRELFDVSPVTFPAYPDTDVSKRDLADAKDSYNKFKSSATADEDKTKSATTRNQKIEDDKRENYLKMRGYLKC